MNKRILVIVVAYNGMRWLERCLGSVPTDADVFVVDNDSTDGSADFVASRFPKARLVRSADNLGFSKANNLGFEWALRKGYDYVYLLNQDAWLEEGALDKLVAAAEAHPDYAVLSPLQYQDGYLQLDKQFEMRYARAKGPRYDKSVIPSEARESPVVGVKTIMAAHWLVPVAALQALGTFEEELFPFYGQDDDWCQRARYAHWRVGIVPEARAVHDRAAREEPLEKTVFRNYYTGSLVRLANVNRPLWERFSFVCLFTLVKAVKYRSWLPFKYFRKICRQLPTVRKHRSAIVARARRAR